MQDGGGVIPNCPNKKAITTTPPNLSCTGHSIFCDPRDRQVPCGKSCTYTPPATNCDSEQAKKKCKEETEKPYTQDWRCHGGNCVPGDPVYFGTGITVYTTEDCSPIEGDPNGDQTGG